MSCDQLPVRRRKAETGKSRSGLRGTLLARMGLGPGGPQALQDPFDGHGVLRRCGPADATHDDHLIRVSEIDNEQE